MTREEEINIAALRYIEENSISAISSNKDSFIEGAKWSDKHPISPWISIEDDLPCNHEDMYNMSGSFIYTNDVLALDGTRSVIVYMIFNDKTGEWKWNKPLNIKYWFPIPKLPGE